MLVVFVFKKSIPCLFSFATDARAGHVLGARLNWCDLEATHRNHGETHNPRHCQQGTAAMTNATRRHTQILNRKEPIPWEEDSIRSLSSIRLDTCDSKYNLQTVC